MIRCHSIITGAVLFVTLGTAGVQAQQAKRPSPTITAESEYMPRRVIVKFRDGVAANIRVAAHEAIDAERIRVLPLIGAELMKLNEMDVPTAVAHYQARAEVEFVEPDYVVHTIGARPTTIPNDPEFSELWGMDNTGQTGGTPDADIDAVEAWEIQTGDSTLIIGVLDTGTDISHPDLAGNVWTNPGEVPANGVDDDGNGYIDDVNGWDFYNDDNTVYDSRFTDDHGTHVSGTIAAVGDNGVGTVGVNWRAQILPVKFIGPNGGTISDAIDAIGYAIENGARLTSNSWGGGDFSQALHGAIAASGDAGMLFVAAAGNDSHNNDFERTYPASYGLDNIIAVAATDDSDALAPFSNYGATTVDLGAPGDDILSTIPDSSYRSFDGTSMAAPHVSGVAALIHAEFPSLTHLEVRQRLVLSGDLVSSLEGLTGTGRRLNAASALDRDATAPAAVTDLRVIGGSTTATSLLLEWTAPGDDGEVGRAQAYDVRYSADPVDDASWANAKPAGGEPVPSHAGVTEQLVIEGLVPDTTYYVAVKTSDNVGNASGLSNVASSATSIAVTVLADDAETEAGVFARSGAWARTTGDSWDGSYSWTDSPGGPYDNNVNTSITSGALDLSAVVNPTLHFSHRYAIEPGDDSAFVEISADSGATWTKIAGLTGVSGWKHESIDLEGYAGISDFRLRFRIDTDGAAAGDGWYIDNILLLGTVPNRLAVGRVDGAPGDTVALPVILQNRLPVAGVDYSLAIHDTTALLEYLYSETVRRAVNHSLDMDVDSTAGTLDAILYSASGEALNSDTLAIVDHTFRWPSDTTVAAFIRGLDTAAVAREIPEDSNSGLPHLFVPVPVALQSGSASDLSGNPIEIGLKDGALDLGLVNTDVDFDGTVTSADIVSMVNVFLDRASFTPVEFLIADAYPDGILNVVDIVRSVNILIGRPIGTDAFPTLAAAALRQDESDRGRSGGGITAHFIPGAASASSSSGRLDLIANLAPGIQGIQLTLRYDPELVELGPEEIPLENVRSVSRSQSGERTIMIYAGGGERLPQGRSAVARVPVHPRTGEEVQIRVEEPVAADVYGRRIEIDADFQLRTAGHDLSQFELSHPYPNPFSGETGLHLDVTVPEAAAQEGPVDIRIYSIRGNLVRTLIDRRLDPGNHRLTWHGRDDRGRLVSSGVYIVLASYPGGRARHQVVFIR